MNIIDDHASECTKFKGESSYSTGEHWECIYGTSTVNVFFWIVFTVPSSMFTMFWLNPNVVLLPWKDVPPSTFHDLLALPSLHLIEQSSYSWMINTLYVNIWYFFVKIFTSIFLMAYGEIQLVFEF